MQVEALEKRIRKIKQELIFINSCENFFRHIAKERVTIYGAGKAGRRIARSIGLSRINYFIDGSAPNGYNFVESIPIISPEPEGCIEIPLLIITTLSYFVVIERLQTSKLMVSKILIPPVELIYQD